MVDLAIGISFTMRPWRFLLLSAESFCCGTVLLGYLCMLCTPGVCWLHSYRSGSLMEGTQAQDSPRPGTEEEFSYRRALGSDGMS